MKKLISSALITGSFFLTLASQSSAPMPDYYPMDVGLQWLYELYFDDGSLQGESETIIEDSRTGGDTLFYLFTENRNPFNKPGEEPASNSVEFHDGIEEANEVYADYNLPGSGPLLMFKHMLQDGESFSNQLFTARVSYIGDFTVPRGSYADCYWMELRMLGLSDSTGFILAPDLGIIAQYEGGILRMALSSHSLPIEVHQDASLCEGDSIFLEGAWQKEEGTFMDVFVTPEGNDSTVYTHVEVLPSYDMALMVTLCEGESYEFDGELLTEEGSYVFEYLTEAGCDSVYTLQVSVVEAFESYEEVNICEGESYEHEGQVLTEAGDYTFEYTSAGGCDSIHTISLFINPAYDISEEVSLCEGGSYEFDGEILTEAGEYTFAYLSEFGCDSIHSLIVSVMPTYESSQEVSICEGESYEYDDQVITEAGEYTFAYSSSYGCDSIHILTVNVLPSYEEEVDVSICEGESYFAGGADQTTAGTYTDTYTSAMGCDSVVVTRLTVDICGAVPLSAAGQVRIYPNPSQGLITIDADDFQRVEFYNIVGVKVFESSDKEINFQHLEKGIYLLQVHTYYHGRSLHRILYP